MHIEEAGSRIEDINFIIRKKVCQSKSILDLLSLIDITAIPQVVYKSILLTAEELLYDCQSLNETALALEKKMLEHAHSNPIESC